MKIDEDKLNDVLMRLEFAEDIMTAWDTSKLDFSENSFASFKTFLYETGEKLKDACNTKPTTDSIPIR